MQNSIELDKVAFLSLLDKCPKGEITENNGKSEIKSFIVKYWDMLSGNVEKTTSEKISSRMEDLKWDKPNIYFKIERHARTINGSSRAELHTWEINTDTWNASIIHHGHRQLRPQDKRLDTKVLAKVVADLIISETEHEYLKWKTPGIYCKLNMEEIIPATNKRTTSDRRSRFKQQLDEFLVNTVWETDKKWTSPGYIKASLTNS